MKKQTKVISLIIVFYVLFFSILPNKVVAENDNKKNLYCAWCTHVDEDDPLYKKEKQFTTKIKIIKSIFKDSIDEIALASAVLHKYLNNDQAYEKEYEENFDEENFKKSWTDIFNSRFLAEFGLTEDEQKQVEANDKIALLTTAAIVMLDSNHNTVYSDVCFRDALAGEKLVNNDGNAGIFGDFINGLVCGVYQTSNLVNPLEYIANMFNGDNLLVTAKSAENRIINTKNVCENGFVGGLYSDIRKIKDEDKKKAAKEIRAQQIIDLANYYKRLYGTMESKSADSCSINMAGTTGTFSAWRQFDDKWKNISLGGSSSVGRAGCLVTSISMQIARSGTKIGSLPSGYSEFNPGAFVTSLNNNRGFSGGGNYAWTGYQSIAPNWGIGDFVSLGVSNNKVLADRVSKELSTGYGSENYQKFLVLQIHHSTSSQHWVAVNGVENGVVTIFDPARNGTTLDENYSGWVVDGYRVMYASDVPFGQTGTTGNNECSSDTGTGTGKIVIPSQYSKPGYFTVTMIDGINWDRSADLGPVLEEWESKGSQYKNGIAVIDGRYLIACTSTFGKAGDKIDFYLDDGTKIPTIMFDEKSQQVVPWDPAPANRWGHDNGANILEFEVHSSYYHKYGNPGNGNNGWYKEWAGKRVASATNLGKDGTSSDEYTSEACEAERNGDTIAKVALAMATDIDENRIYAPDANPWAKVDDPRAQTAIKIMDEVIGKYPRDDKSNPNYRVPGYNNNAYASCAQAAAGVIRATVDPDFETNSPLDIKKYLESHPEKWNKAGVLRHGEKLESKLRPGDLLVWTNGEGTNGHVAIYVGNELVRTKFPNYSGNIYEANYGSGNAIYPRITWYKSSWANFEIWRPTGGGTNYYPFIDISAYVDTSNMCTSNMKCVNGRAVGVNNDSNAGYKSAELAVRVATGAEGYQSRVYAHANLHCGTQRASIDPRMHDYIKIMDATTTKWMKEDWNGDPARNYFNNPNAATSGSPSGYNNNTYCSCTQATASIIRATVDPDFDMSGDPTKYLESHPEKWVKVGRIKTGEKYDDFCKPGDLLSVQRPGITTHVMMYVGNELVRTRFPNSKANIYEGGFAGNNSESSWCPGLDKLETPEARRGYFDIWRPTGGGENTYPLINVDEVLAGPLQTGAFWPGCTGF